MRQTQTRGHVMLVRTSEVDMGTFGFVRPVTALVALAVAACLPGCAHPQVQVKTAALSDMGSVRTYAWSPVEGDIVGVYGSRGQLAAEVMRQSIDKGLQRNGFRPAAEGEPDVLVL